MARTSGTTGGGESQDRPASPARRDADGRPFLYVVDGWLGDGRRCDGLLLYRRPDGTYAEASEAERAAFLQRFADRF